LHLSKIKLLTDIDFSFSLTLNERWKKDNPDSTENIMKKDIIKEKREIKNLKINQKKSKKRNREENLDTRTKRKKFRKKRKNQRPMSNVRINQKKRNRSKKNQHKNR